MSEIFGFVNLNGEKACIEKLLKMQSALGKFSADGRKIKMSQSAAMGFHQICITPESRFEDLPIYEKNNEILFTATARLDNRDELCSIFGISYEERIYVSDAELVYRAWQKWEECCVRQLFGEWSVALWNEKTGQLSVARDHLGNTGLYYYYKAPYFVFASNVEAVLSHPDVTKELDETRFAHFLITHFEHDCKNTLWKNIATLLPAHFLTVNSHNLTLKKYWNLEDITVKSFSSDSDYLDTFLELFRRAVSVRLRSVKPVASTLSSGLDSASVTALAAEQLQKQGKRLSAFTSRPSFHQARSIFRGQTDEWCLAHLVAEQYENIDHYPIVAKSVSPLGAIRRSFQISKSLPHALANMFWINAILDAVKEHGAGVLLTGQMGNSTISWNGGSQRILWLFSQGRWSEGKRALIEWKKARGKSLLMALMYHLIGPITLPLRRKLRKSSGLFLPKYSKYSIISPDFANQAGVCSFSRAGFKKYFRLKALHPNEERHFIINKNTPESGPFWQGCSSFFGVEVRDPTLDVRLLEFCLGIPNEEYAYKGGDRMLIRRAMSGIIPDKVRWNPIRGMQAVDIGFRLLEHGREVESELREIENSKMIKNYLCVSTMREVWENFKANQTPQNSFWLATLFLRGFSAGVFLRFHFPRNS